MYAFLRSWLRKSVLRPIMREWKRRKEPSSCGSDSTSCSSVSHQVRLQQVRRDSSDTRHFAGIHTCTLQYTYLQLQGISTRLYYLRPYGGQIHMLDAVGKSSWHATVTSDVKDRQTSVRFHFSMSLQQVPLSVHLQIDVYLHMYSSPFPWRAEGV